MKKLLTIMMSVLMCFTLSGCGNKHEELIDLVENKDYDKAIEYINNLAYEDAVNKGTIDKKAMTKALINEWTLFENAQYTDVKKIEFKDDYTVYIDDEKYLWEVASESDEYIHVNILDGASKYASVSASFDTKYKLNYSIYDEEQDCYVNGRYFFNDSTFKKVELTTDNWDTYFEVVDTYSFSKDSFDEVTSSTYVQRLQLKDKYLKKLCPENYNVAFEISFDRYEHGVEIDFENEKLTLTEKGKLSSSNSTTGKMNFVSSDKEKYFGQNIYTTYETKDSYDQKFTVYDNVNVTRIQGHIYLEK